MKDIDLSLDMLKVPLMEGYSPSVGTWVSATEQNKGVLTAAEVADNVALPWTRNRPVLVYESCRLGRADYDAVIVAAENGITVILPEACSYMGCTVTVRAFPGISSVTVADSAGKAMCSVMGGTSAEFFWDGGKFVTMSVSGAGGSGGGFSQDMPYKNGMWAFDPFNNPIAVLADSKLNDVFVTGTAKKNGVTDNALQVSRIQHIKAIPDPLPENLVVIRMKPNNLECDRKAFFLCIPHTSGTSSPVWTAYGCVPPDKDGKIVARTRLGCACVASLTGTDRMMYRDMFNRASNPNSSVQWLPFNFRLSDMVRDEEGYVFIGLSCDLATAAILCWGMADRNSDRIVMPVRAIMRGLMPFSSLTVVEDTKKAGIYDYVSVPARSQSFYLIVPVDRNLGDVRITIVSGNSVATEVWELIADSEIQFDPFKFSNPRKDGYIKEAYVLQSAILPKEFVDKADFEWYGYRCMQLFFTQYGASAMSLYYVITESV